MQAGKNAGAGSGASMGVAGGVLPPHTWPAYAASAWSILFGLGSFYMALGGEVGARTLGNVIYSMLHQPVFIAILWITGVAKIVGGLFALTLVRDWARWLPSIWKLVLAWVGGIALTLYGGVQFIVEGSVLAGIVKVSGPVDWFGLRWHVWLWDPFWTLGGILFLLAAWQYQRWRRTSRG